MGWRAGVWGVVLGGGLCSGRGVKGEEVGGGLGVPLAAESCITSGRRHVYNAVLLVTYGHLQQLAP